MILVETKKNLNSSLSLPSGSKGLGLVPTMGALHEGHLSLVRKALEENERVVVSIFVNPTQFDNPEDLEKYPKTLEADMALLKTVSDNLIVFAPTANEVYEGVPKVKNYDFDGLDLVMEGQYRPGHFNGVATIVETLFNLVAPDRAYFGEKDYQQIMIIKKMVEARGLSVEVITCPIVREPNGLAMSSRNQRLSPAGRNEAAFIYKTLSAAREKFRKENANATLRWVEARFGANPHLELEYAVIANANTLSPPHRKERGRTYRIFVAAYIEGVRLIDNIALN